MYIGIGTIVVIVIIVLVVLMLRRLCYAAAPAILIRRLSKSHDGRGYINRPRQAAAGRHAARTDPDARPRPRPAV
jgi:uncharacterized membrane protein YqiK